MRRLTASERASDNTACAQLLLKAGRFDEAKAQAERAGLPGVLGNCHASGTTIIAELGEEHMRTGKPIVYTSADSVFQIAAHDEVCDLDELYRVCDISRKMLTGEHQVHGAAARSAVVENGGLDAHVGRVDQIFQLGQGGPRRHRYLHGVAGTVPELEYSVRSAGIDGLDRKTEHENCRQHGQERPPLEVQEPTSPGG